LAVKSILRLVIAIYIATS